MSSWGLKGRNPLYVQKDALDYLNGDLLPDLVS